MVAMVRGLEKKLGRCSTGVFATKQEFCIDAVVYQNVKGAYNALWNTLEKSKDYLSDEVWSWRYIDREFVHTPLGSMPPPPGVSGSVESDIIQLWSLTFLALKRDESLR